MLTLQVVQEINMSLTINHQTDDISNLTGAVTFNGVAVGGDNTKPYGSRGVFAGGNNGGGNSDFSNVIQYVTIATTGNATDFGNLTVSREATGACSGT